MNDVTPMSDQAKTSKEVLETILDKMDFPATVEVAEVDEQIVLTIVSDQPMGVLIGKGGQTLNALELIVKQVVQHKTGERDRYLMIDAEGYRTRQATRLQEQAREVANRVMETNRPVSMEPMHPRDRRTVHVALMEFPEVETYSEGEDPYRRVVVCPKGQRPEWLDEVEEE